MEAQESFQNLWMILNLSSGSARCGCRVRAVEDPSRTIDISHPLTHRASV